MKKARIAVAINSLSRLIEDVKRGMIAPPRKPLDAAAFLDGPLLIQEEQTSHRREQLRDDSCMIVWWACRLECSSAPDRLCREGSLDEKGLAQALHGLETLADVWYEVQPSSSPPR